jgi:hypothetical protein
MDVVAMFPFLMILIVMVAVVATWFVSSRT